MMSTSIISFFLATVMLFTPVCAGAQVDVLFESPTNYAEETSYKITLDNSEEFYQLLKDFEIPEEYEYFADIPKFLETLFSTDGKICVQADISDDKKKAQIAVTSDNYNSVDFNRNLKFDVSAKLGMWITYDFTDAENPVFEMIYSIPRMEKYVHIDVFDMLTDGQKEKVVSLMDESIALGNNEKTNAFTLKLFENYADVKASLTGATIKIDNKGLVGIIKEMLEYTTTNALASLTEEDRKLMKENIEAFDFENLQILGKDGIVINYSFKNGNISAISTLADISLDVDGLFTFITGVIPDFETEKKIDFTVNAETVLSKIGSTKVEIPTLTEKNSISLSDMIKEEMEYEQSEYQPSYPYYHVWVPQAENLPVIDGELYVPLRKTLENAYDNSVKISFENGVITASCEYFPDFKTIQLTNESDKVYFDDVEKTTSKVFILDGITYVSNELFNEHFGWNFYQAVYDMLEDAYSYSFITK